MNVLSTPAGRMLGEGNPAARSCVVDSLWWVLKRVERATFGLFLSVELYSKRPSRVYMSEWMSPYKLRGTWELGHGPLSQCLLPLLLSTYCYSQMPLQPAKELHFTASLAGMCGHVNMGRLRGWKQMMGLQDFSLKRETVFFFGPPSFLLQQSSLRPWNNFKDSKTESKKQPQCYVNWDSPQRPSLPISVFILWDRKKKILS